MNCLLQVSPTTLILIEGCGQTGYVQCWGDGFVTDASIIQKVHNMSNPSAFFQALHGTTFLNNVVVSPHVYPPSIANPAYDDLGFASGPNS